MQHFLEELQGSLRLCTLSAGTTQGSVGDPIWQEAMVQHCLEELQGSLRLFTLSEGTNQGIVGEPVWQDSLVQHFLEELHGSLRLCTLSAGTTQSSVGDPVWQEAVVQHCLEELQGSLRLFIRFSRHEPRHCRRSRLAGGLGAALSREAARLLRLFTLSAGTNKGIVGDLLWQEALV